MVSMMQPHQSNVNLDPAGPRRWTGKERLHMLLDPIVADLAVAAFIVIALALFGMAALRYGVDSRPDIGDRDRRPWLFGG